MKPNLLKPKEKVVEKEGEKKLDDKKKKKKKIMKNKNCVAKAPGGNRRENNWNPETFE